MDENVHDDSVLFQDQVLAIVGGASGVGKSTLLAEVPEAEIINTGNLFRSRMSDIDRDDIKKNDWSAFEELVADDLGRILRERIGRSKLIVIDTHFAAKLKGRYYRIGLNQNLIFSVVRQALEQADLLGFRVKVYIALISCNPHSLLRRRRLDRTRSRELIPSDCVHVLKDNRAYSRQYHFEAMRAVKAVSSLCHWVEYSEIENDVIESATTMLRRNLLGV